MKHEKALAIGIAHANVAAEAIQRWTGVKAIAVFAVKSVPGIGSRASESWEPVGTNSYKEIARDDGMRGGGNYHLLVVDDSGTAKACTLQRYPLAEVLKLAGRLPLAVASPGEGELWKRLVQQDDRRYAVDRAKHPDL
jgi:hypothetical protein